MSALPTSDVLLLGPGPSPVSRGRTGRGRDLAAGPRTRREGPARRSGGSSWGAGERRSGKTLRQGTARGLTQIDPRTTLFGVKPAVPAACLAVLLTAGCLLSVSHVEDERLPASWREEIGRAHV